MPPNTPHAYDHTCCCMDCVEHERRLRAQAEYDKGNEEACRRARREADGYYLRLQLLEAGK